MKLSLSLGKKSHDIVIKSGALARAGFLANLCGKVMIVTDEGVPKNHVAQLIKQCNTPFVHTLPMGEKEKTMHSVCELQSNLLQAEICAKDTIVAIGGSNCVNIAGFSAATFGRGLPVVNIPTTASTQCGAAIGGANYLNLNNTKNRLCVLHHPSLVIVDPDLLKTLPNRVFSSGISHAIIAAIACNSNLFCILEDFIANLNEFNFCSDPQVLEQILYLSLLIKKGIVERDENCQNEQILLRLGSTLGQCIMAADEEGRFLQGEAFLLGMLPFIESRSLLLRVKRLMQKLNLPLKHNIAPEKLWPFLKQDETKENGNYIITRVKTLGQAYYEQISEKELALIIKYQESSPK